jgi:hypothetical protein
MNAERPTAASASRLSSRAADIVSAATLSALFRAAPGGDILTASSARLAHPGLNFSTRFPAHATHGRKKSHHIRIA